MCSLVTVIWLLGLEEALGFSCQDCGQGERFVPGGLLLFLCYGLVGAWSCLLWAPLVPFGEGWLVGGTKLWCRGVESVVITQFACLGSGGRWAPILRQWQLGPVGAGAWPSTARRLGPLRQWWRVPGSPFCRVVRLVDDHSSDRGWRPGPGLRPLFTGSWVWGRPWMAEDHSSGARK